MVVVEENSGIYQSQWVSSSERHQYLNKIS